MNIINLFNEDKTIRTLLNCLYILIILLYFSALILIAFGEEIYKDFDTALYWFNEIIKTVASVQNIILSAILILIFIYKN